ncbi:MAG TPA: ATP-dependent Clp protease adaptor ClpS, partial [Verrucomicrobiae bacterium]
MPSVLEPATVPTPDTDTRSRPHLAPTFFVICWNDPVNLMTYVTHVFMKIFGWDKTKAEK